MNLTMILIGLVIAAVGIGIALTGIQQKNRSIAASAWPTVRGRILTSNMDVQQTDPDAPAMCTPKVRFEYEVDGKWRQSERIAYGESTRDASEAAVREVLAKYPAGAPVQVHVNPADPADAALVPGATRVPVSVWIVAIVLVALGGVVAVRGVNGAEFEESGQ